MYIQTSGGFHETDNEDIKIHTGKYRGIEVLNGNRIQSRFRKWFVKELIKAFDGENDVVVITFDEKYNEKGDPVQKFYSADNIDLEVMPNRHNSSQTF